METYHLMQPSFDLYPITLQLLCQVLPGVWKVLKSKRGHFASDILTFTVEDRYSKRMGRVNDLLLDSNSYLVDYILVGKDCIIPISFINSDDSIRKILTVSQCKNRVRQAIFKQKHSVPKKCFSYSDIRDSIVYDINGTELGTVDNIAYHPGLRVDFLVGKPDVIRLSSFFDFAPDYFVIPVDFIGQILKDSVVLNVPKTDIGLVNFSGFECLYSTDPQCQDNKKRYVIVEAPANTVRFYLDQRDEILRDATENVFIESLDVKSDGKVQQFVNLFNTVMATSPDTYIPLSTEDARKYFTTGTFVAQECYKPVGYCSVTIEKQEENDQKTGCIAGIGVHPARRGKKIALALIDQALRYLNENEVDKIQADIYELNIPSLRFFSSLGFREVGETFLV